MVTYDVTVCIPTYRRPTQLLALVRALAHQWEVTRFSLLIGNNDAETVLPLVRTAIGSSVQIEEIFVTERGVAAVRNAMIAAVVARRAVKWIACLDDDQLPEPEWLLRLVASGRRNRADVVGGPVQQIPERRTFWAGGVAANKYLPTIEGEVETLNEAGNLLLSVDFLSGLTRAAFSPKFGRSGGEDYEFFLYARQIRARIFWVPDAFVTEIIPYQRLTLRGFAWRSYSTSVYQTRADMLYKPYSNILLAICWKFFVIPGAILRVFAHDLSLRNALAEAVRRSAGLIGNIVGLTGRKIPRYGGELTN